MSLRYRQHPLTLAVLLLAATLALGGRTSGGQESSRAARSGPSILLLVGEDPGTPYVQGLIGGFRERLAEEPSATLYLEFVDLLRFSGDGYRAEMARFLEVKYRDHSFDAMVAIGGGAAGLIGASLQPLWPDVPVLYPSMAEPMAEAAAVRDVSALVLENPLPELFATIRTLLPGTRRIGLILGASPVERARGRWYAEQMTAAGFGVTDLGAPTTLDHLLSQVAHLPADTVLFLESFQIDATGQFVGPDDPCARIARASNRPLFMLGRIRLGCGIVGGPLLDFPLAGRELAGLVLRRLAGMPATTTMLPLQAFAAPVFDAAALTRWGIAESRLPAGSEVLFRPSGLWRDHRLGILATLGVVATLTLVVGGLLVEQRRRRRSQDALETSYHEAQDLARRLLSAGERERVRIARDLNDDLRQSLALLTGAVGQLQEDVGATSPATAAQVAALVRRSGEVATSVQNLAHQLHPSKLESLGLEAALRTLCDEFAVPDGLQVSFRCAGLSDPVSPAAALCVFRVAQEALQNVVKHCGSGRADVVLAADRRAVTLEVIDTGPGFVPAAREGGLGMVSMRERTHLAGGMLTIRSGRGGTRVIARVPADAPGADPSAVRIQP